MRCWLGERAGGPGWVEVWGVRLCGGFYGRAASRGKGLADFRLIFPRGCGFNCSIISGVTRLIPGSATII